MTTRTEVTEWFERCVTAQGGSGKTGRRVNLPIFELPLTNLFESCCFDGEIVSPTMVGTIADAMISGVGLTCRSCGMTFTNRMQQQEHFGSLLHVTNLRRSLRGRPPLDAEEFQALSSEGVVLQEDSDDDSEEEKDKDTRNTGELLLDSSDESDFEGREPEDGVLRKNVLSSSEYGKIARTTPSNVTGPLFSAITSVSSPVAWTMSSALFNTTSALSQPDWSCIPPKDQWRDMYTQLHALHSRPMVAVFILRSGRFVGAFFDYSVARASKPRQLGGVALNGDCSGYGISGTQGLIAHKVLRRYTVRAKAGGGQSSHDNKGRKAKSMGSQLRRYGEKALTEDIRGLMESWQPLLKDCGLILLATTKTMRRQLIDMDGSENSSVLLKKDDPRIVNVPFLVGRPTLEEAQIVREKVLQVVVTDKPLAELTESTTPSQAVLSGDPDLSSLLAGLGLGIPLPVTAESQPAKVIEQSKTPVIEETNTLEGCDIAVQLFALINDQNKNDNSIATELQAILSTNFPAPLNSQVNIDVDTNIEADDDQDDGDEDGDVSAIATVRLASQRICEEWDLRQVLDLPENYNSLDTLLHVATRRELAATIRNLLLNGANPERLNSSGVSPYRLSDSKAVRNVYRRVRARLGESVWQWSRAGVPEALDEDAVNRRRNKEKEKKKRAAQRKRDEKAAIEAAEKAAAEAEKKRKEDEAARIAAILEARPNCANARCGKKITDVPFELLGVSLCSTTCATVYRRQVQADAAMARMRK